MINKILYHILHFCMLFSCFLNGIHVFPKSRKSLTVLSERENLTHLNYQNKTEEGNGDVKKVYHQNGKSNLEYMWKPRGVWDECLTCSCDGQLWVHLSASKRNTWCESRRVTRDARVVARDAFKRARQHLWPMSLLCVVETRPVWRHTFLTSSHISWQISNNEEMT